MLQNILRNGDTVKIITSKNNSPSLHWIPITKTGKARSAIRRYWHERGEKKEERIKKYNPSLNAIVSIKDEEQIINEANDKDKNFDESKPLFGLPLASKDLLDVVDFPTTYGFPGYRDYFPNKN